MKESNFRVMKNEDRLNMKVNCGHLRERLEQWLPTFPMPGPFNMVPRVEVTAP